MFSDVHAIVANSVGVITQLQTCPILKFVYKPRKLTLLGIITDFKRNFNKKREGLGFACVDINTCPVIPDR